jgi:CRP-like cAMP-binding protein
MGATNSHLYFVESGLVALAKPLRDGRTAEIGAVGCEGIVSPTGVFGADRTVMASIVEIPATVLRIDRHDFRERLLADRDFSAIVLRYAGVVMSQLTQTAACNILHSIEQRCCRWLLIAHDSALAQEFCITHDFIAKLLGVRRAGVQTAAASLQRAGLIRYTRGKVTVSDRPGLEAAACECYATLQAELEELFPQPTRA